MTRHVVATFAAACAAILSVAPQGTRADGHGAPFSPEAMRPAMEWVDREADRSAPFLQLDFRSAQSAKSVNASRILDPLRGYEPSGTNHGPPDDGATYYFLIGKDPWSVVYDPVERVAYYGHGCCSFTTVVLMRAESIPPKSVPRRDLRAMATERGVRLGMHMSEVVRREGQAPRVLGPT